MAIPLERTLAYSRDLQHATTLADLVDATRRAVCEVTRYRTTWIAVFERAADGEWVRILAAEGKDAQIVWEQTPRFPVGNDAMLLEIREGRHPVVVEDMQTDPRTDKEIVSRSGHRTTINVPLLFGDVVLGALGVSTFGDEGVMPPTPDELEHLTVFATLLAAAFDRVRLLDEKRRADEVVTRTEAERGELERQLRHAQKMEAVGMLAGGIAHDFNNILTAILAHAELMQMQLPKDSPLQESLQVILDSGKHAAHLTHNLLSFSRRQVVARRPLSVQRLVRALADLVQPVLREDLHLVLDLPPGDLVVSADETELEQVLMNLVNNARDAMPRGGTIRIRAESFVVDDEFVLRHGKTLLGPCAHVAVTDGGVGMDAATVQHIFEPFFTTKGPKRGTGLGLATAQAIVEQHGGAITVDTIPNQGTTFDIYLPLATATLAERPRAQGAKPGAGGTETILLAEDDEPVRDLIARLLRGQGYRVIVATDGQEAIDKFRAESAAIDLVLTDLVMPERTGLDLYEVVRGFRQGTKVIFTSGYAADVLDQSRVSPDDLHILQKPIRPTVLLETIRATLDEPKAA